MIPEFSNLAGHMSQQAVWVECVWHVTGLMVWRGNDFTMGEPIDLSTALHLYDMWRGERLGSSYVTAMAVSVICEEMKSVFSVLLLSTL